MASTPRPERKPMGLEVDCSDREEADRIAAAMGLKVSQVLRLAITTGLPLVARRLLGNDGNEAA